MRIAAGSYTNSKARSMKEWAEKNKDKIKESKRKWRERQKEKNLHEQFNGNKVPDTSGT